MSKIAIIFSVISFVILAYIAFVVVFAISKSTCLKTDDGRETNYFKKLGTIHYRQADNVFSLIYNPVSGANAKTFKPIDYSFGKDKKHIFYRDTKQPHVDCKTFEVIIEKYKTTSGESERLQTVRDKNHEYETDWEQQMLVPVKTSLEQQIELIDDADIQKEFLNNPE